MRYLSCFLLLIVLTMAQPAGAKENKDLMRANYYYTHYAYHDAIPWFEKVVGELNDPAVYARLADCYMVTSDLVRAADNYGKAVTLPGCTAPVVLRYGQLLIQLGRYGEAEKWLTAYQQTAKNERRVKNLIASCRTAKQRMEQMPEGVATMLAFNTEGSDFAPSLYQGMLVFASDTAIDIKKKTDNWTGRSYYNIYSVSCQGADCTGELNKLTEGKNVNIKYHTGPCTFTSDGRQMYFTRSRYQENLISKRSVANKEDIVLLEIMVASDYDTASRKFRTITPFEYNNKEHSVAHPTVSPNGKLLVFSSNMPRGIGGSDLYLCKRTGNRWGKPQNIGNVLNTEGEEVFPYWADNTTLFFSSDGQEGIGGLDIYRAVYNESTGIFSQPDPAGVPVNSPYDDISMALRADGGNCYFSSNRPAAKGGDNIYYYHRQRLFLRVDVLDSLTGLPLAGASVDVGSPHDKKSFRSAGESWISGLYPGDRYTVLASKGEYGQREVSLTAASAKDVDTLYAVVKLFRRVPPPRDTMPKLYPGPLVVKLKNVMDTPGISVFEVNEVYELGHFYYEYDKSRLTEVHKLILDTLLTQMRRHPTMCIEIRAHTDCRGSDAYNKKLSENRALAVVNFLIKNGVARTRLTYKGLGASEPLVKCECVKCTEQEHYLNRILDFKVLKL